jgi:arylsulfatase A-like enzyme
VLEELFYMMSESQKKKKSVSSRLCRRRFLNWTLSLSITRFISTYVTTTAGLSLSSCARPAPKDQRNSFSAQNRKESTRPNFIIILCDNLGYGDVGCFGSKLHRTPNIDRMAQQGIRFTDFYATSGVCTPSRASLMTACYPRRVNMHVAEDGRPVLSPVAKKGLHPEEITIAELLKTRGYSTACIGKWHLGDQLPFLPTRQGFDYYVGIPYSDDMTARPERDWPPLPLMENEQVIEAPVDRNLLTKRYTEKAIEFIKANKEKPFFVYLSHAMPGSTTSPFSSRQFQRKSANGPWGDSVEELDWSTGEILKALKQLNLDERTLVVWTSDNGAPRRNPSQGLNAPLAGWGYTCSEGGQRIPCIMCWPGRIPAGKTCSELCTTMDLLPTFAHLAGKEPPKDRVIDGHDIWPLMVGDVNANSPYEAFYYYYVGQIQAVRSGRWKLHLPLEAKWRNFRGDTMASEAELYDLKTDIDETRNLVDKHPDIVKRLQALAEKARVDLGDTDRPSIHQRSAGMVVNPTPRILRQ